MHTRHVMFACCFVWLLIAARVGCVEAAAGPDDKAITLWVDEALGEDLRLDSSQIQVTTQDGIVTLKGMVRTLAGKHYANLEAQKIAGVRGVIDDLQVMPSYLFDADVAQNVRRRLGSSASLTSYSSSGLGVRVDDGVVTLTGSVNSYAESREASLLAGEVDGVREVIDKLTVTYPRQRSDAEIQTDVTTTLNNDVYLSGRPIHVAVTDGMVTLTGTVGSVYQKQRAGTAARLVWNVNGVDNQLRVAPGSDAGVRRQDPNLSDAQIETAVRATLTTDQRLQPEAITVQAHEGDVTLLGSVPSYYQERVAGEDALHVVGVGRIFDQLTVRTVRRDDAALQDDVQFHLNSDVLFRPDTITARVRNGIVTLTGNVHDNPERDHAIEVAARVIGVRKVVSHIEVNWGPDDRMLQRTLERHLSANAETNWVAKSIHVAVKQGNVTLSGQVNFQSERDAAGRVADQTDGVRSVNNQLSVVSPEG